SNTTSNNSSNNSNNNNAVSIGTTPSSVTSRRRSTPNPELIDKLSTQPIPIIMPPSYKPEAKYERYVTQLVGKVIMSAALVSKTPGQKLKNTLMAQKGLLIKFNETIQICDALSKGRLHMELISISGTKYIVTTVKERSFYGVNTNQGVGGGIIIVLLDTVILVALFPASVLPTESIPYVENFVATTII
ncbi:hypothetical protein SAMD00019534_029240, partial [Acytostelium subglobosum LB1]|uniref:hypothetical protein n=1 Tax=Acytostelium subglobosum LB1 TaxID=1410327 RepID=UPI0006450916